MRAGFRPTIDPSAAAPAAPATPATNFLRFIAMRTSDQGSLMSSWVREYREGQEPPAAAGRPEPGARPKRFTRTEHEWKSNSGIRRDSARRPGPVFQQPLEISETMVVF